MTDYCLELDGVLDGTLSWFTEDIAIDGDVITFTMPATGGPARSS